MQLSITRSMAPLNVPVHKPTNTEVPSSNNDKVGSVLGPSQGTTGPTKARSFEGHGRTVDKQSQGKEKRVP